MYLPQLDGNTAGKLLVVKIGEDKQKMEKKERMKYQYLPFF